MCIGWAYSLEVCGRWTLLELSGEEDQEGTYISDSLNRLFQLIWEASPRRRRHSQLPLADTD